MTDVDIELSWGDERLSASDRPIDAVFDPGGPFDAMRPFETDGDTILLTVPARTRVWVLTAGGWRDLMALRGLGCVRPHPEISGAAQVRMRRIRDAKGRSEGVALVREVEARFELDGWFLRVGLSEGVDAVPRFDRRALCGAAVFVTLVILSFTGVLTALASTPPYLATLSTSRLRQVHTIPLPPVRVNAIEHVSSPPETKHDVLAEPTGGPRIADVYAPVEDRPSAPAANPPTSQPRRRRGGRRARLAAAAGTDLATSLFDLDSEPLAALDTAAPAEPREPATPHDASDPDRNRTRSASLRGTLDRGWGRGLGRSTPRRILHVPSARLPAVPLHYDDCDPRIHHGICERRGARRDAIRNVIHRHRAQVRFCHERVPSSSHGRLTVRFTVQPDGRARDVSVVENELDDDEIAACVQRCISRWTFPPGPRPTEISYPFQFRLME